MHFPILSFLISTTHATLLLARRESLLQRDVDQGWSLQSSSYLPSLHSCGNLAYCPISLHCNTAKNTNQVVACCSSTSDCRGEVSGAPRCADPAWNLWIGYDGNGFCCEAGLIGAYDIKKDVAGTCVSPGGVGSLRSAILTSTGTAVVAVKTSADPEEAAATSSAVMQVTLSTGETVTSAATAVVAKTTATSTLVPLSSNTQTVSGTTSPSSTTNTGRRVGERLGLVVVGIAVAVL